MNKLHYFFIFLLFPLCGKAEVDLSKYDWWEVKSTHVTLVTNGKKSHAKDMADDLSEFRQAMEALNEFKLTGYEQPLRIFAFSDEASFSALGWPEGLMGLYFYTEAGPYAIFDASGYSDKYVRKYYRHILFHEYYHYLSEVSNTAYIRPRWYEEGMAEYYSTIEVDDDEIDYGKISKARLYEYRQLVGEYKLPGLEGMFKDETSFAHDDASKFYQLALFFIHNGLSNTETRRSYQDFLASINNGVHVDDAWGESFKLSYDEVSKSVAAYPYRVKFSHFTRELDEDIEAVDRATSALTSEEVSYYLHDLAYRMPINLGVSASGVNNFPLEFDSGYQASIFYIENLISEASYDEAKEKIKILYDKYGDSSSLYWVGGYRYLMSASLFGVELDDSWHKNLKLAKGYFRKSIRLDNTNYRSYVGLGDVYLELVKQDSSISVAEGVTAYTEASSLYSNRVLDEKLADLFSYSGQIEMSKTYYERSLRRAINEIDRERIRVKLFNIAGSGD